MGIITVSSLIHYQASQVKYNQQKYQTEFYFKNIIKDYATMQHN